MGAGALQPRYMHGIAAAHSQAWQGARHMAEARYMGYMAWRRGLAWVLGRRGCPSLRPLSFVAPPPPLHTPSTLPLPRLPGRAACDQRGA